MTSLTLLRLFAGCLILAYSIHIIIRANTQKGVHWAEGILVLNMSALLIGIALLTLGWRPTM